jgi:epoxyqueuosine reductase
LSDSLTSEFVKQTALDCGFDLAGIAFAAPAGDFARYREWVAAGMAGEMAYLTDHRRDLRADARELLPSAKTLLAVGKRYNKQAPSSLEAREPGRAWISRYAWGADYHDWMRKDLERVVGRLQEASAYPFDWRICVDTAPLLERSYARLAGLGWIGRNTCLINEEQGSWLFLGELLLSLELEPDVPAPVRCGTCRRCIDACPTGAIVPKPDGTWALDARLCISYYTIEKRGAIPADQHAAIGNHVFGCDICQDVCPWNAKAARAGLHAKTGSDFPEPLFFAPDLQMLAGMTEDEFRTAFRHTPVSRAKYRGFLRNVAIAMGNSGRQELLEPLRKLSEHRDPLVAEAAQTAHGRLLHALGKA